MDKSRTILQDDDINIIREILETGYITPDVKQYFDKYDLRNGVVFRRSEKGNKWVVPRSCLWRVIKMCHGDQGHFALDETLEKAKGSYWFKGMRKFISKYLNACLRCLYYKAAAGRKPGYLHPIEIVLVPFHTLHIDHQGPFVKSNRKNTQILAMIDGFTKFCILEPVRNTKAKWAIKSLEQLFGLFGVPTRLISDRGTAFTSHQFREFCKEYGIKHVLNAVASPRANGQCERLNRVVISSLAATCAGEPEDRWDINLKKVQSAVNCTVNRTTQRSPAQLLLGYIPRSAADASLLEGIQQTLDQVDLTQLREEAKLLTREEEANQNARSDARKFKAPVY